MARAAATRVVAGNPAVNELELCLPGRPVAESDATELQLQSWVLELYDKLRVPLFRYLVCIGIPREEADEVLQETFLRAYKHLRGGGETGNFRSWIFRVAHNLAINQLKKQRRLSVGGLELCDLAPPVVDPSPDAEELLLRKERLRRICAAMKTLSATELQCVHLRAEGLRYREIADVMGCGVSTVADSLRRAIAKLAGGDDA